MPGLPPDLPNRDLAETSQATASRRRCAGTVGSSPADWASALVEEEDPDDRAEDPAGDRGDAARGPFRRGRAAGMPRRREAGGEPAGARRARAPDDQGPRRGVLLHRLTPGVR